MSNKTIRFLTFQRLGEIVWFLVLLNSGGLRIIPNYVITLLTYLLLFMMLLHLDSVRAKPIIPPFLILFSLTVINMLSTNSLQQSKFYIIQISFFLTAALFTVVYRGRSHDFLSGLYVVLKLHMWYALLSFVIGILLINFVSFVELMGSIQKTIFYLFYYPTKDTIPFVMRNQGLFWEPGILQYYMNILLLLSLIKKDYTISSLSTFIVLTTFSTTGYISITILITLYLFSILKSKVRKKKIIIITCALVLIIPLVIFSKINIYNKIDKGFQQGGHSAMIRYYDYIFGIKMITEHPLFGIGLDNEKIKNNYSYYYYSQPLRFLADEFYGTKGLTNSLISSAVMWGIPIAGFLLWLIYRQQIIPGKKYIFFLITITFFIGEPLFLSPFIAIMQLSGLTKPETNHLAENTNIIYV